MILEGDSVAKKVIETWYSIREISSDGLVKEPKEDGYSGESPRFCDDYGSMEEVDEAILKDGEQWANYVVLTMKRITEDDSI